MSFREGVRVEIIANIVSGISHLIGEYGTVMKAKSAHWNRYIPIMLDNSEKAKAFSETGVPALPEELRLINGIELIKKRHNL